MAEYSCIMNFWCLNFKSTFSKANKEKMLLNILKFHIYDSSISVLLVQGTPNPNA